MNGRSMRTRQRRNDSGGLRLWPAGLVVACLAAVAVIAMTWPGPTVTQHLRLQRSSAAGAAGAAGASSHVRVCGNAAVLGGGPSSAPAGAVRVRAGDNSGVDFGRAGVTYWFAPGVHTLGRGRYTQIDPGRGSTFVGAPGAVLDGLHENFYAFGGNASRVTISYLTVRHFGKWGGNQNEGVVNHDSAHLWTIDHSTVTDNAGAGVMLGSRDRLSYDCLKNNQQYGFNAYSVPSPARLVMDHNEIAGNDTYNWEKHISGCGCTGGGKFWAVRGAVIRDNWVHGNHSVGLWADTNNRGFDISGNYISGNYNFGLIYEISYNAQITGNTFARNGLGAGAADNGFPTGAIYLSESGSDSRVAGKYGTGFAVTGNLFRDNWGGVILWENANRFCGSPANSSTGACTLVNRPTVTARSCVKANVGHRPFYGDCRWKTQNVSVDHNVFDFSPAAIGAKCTARQMCGFQGVFSEYGTYPSWSPYKADSVENHITFNQHNHFTSNTYNGPWRFMIHELGNSVSWATWRGARYHQDGASALDRQSTG
jgi:hypothetical protein